MDDDQLKATFVEGNFVIQKSNVPRSIYVKGFSEATDPDNLIIHFQRRRNGGGDIKSITIKRKKGAAVITFDNEEVVQSVQQKEHKYEGAVLSVMSCDAALKKDQDFEEALPRSRSPFPEQQRVNRLVKPDNMPDKDLNKSSRMECKPMGRAGGISTTKRTYANQDYSKSFQLGQKDREERSESDLERQRSPKDVLEQRGYDLETALAAKENKWQELENSSSLTQRALSEFRSNCDVELSRLRKEIKVREEHFEIELGKERNAKKEAEQHAANLQTTLTAKESEVQELQTSTQRTMDALRAAERRVRNEIEGIEEEKGKIETRCIVLLIEIENLKQEGDAKTHEIERILLQQEQFKIELEREVNGKEEAEQHVANLQTTLTATQNRVQELQTNLSSAQRELSVCRQRDDLELRCLREENERFKHFQSDVNVTDDLEVRRLRKVIERLEEEKESIENRCSEILIEKQRLEEETEARANEIESIQLEQIERQEQFEIELEREGNGKEEAEQRTANLQSTLTATLNQLQELQASQRNEARDWVLSRDEIHPSDKVVGEGAWATVYQGKFRGSKIAVKVIHELILSPHNRNLFEREMMVASTCRHPCLLQFIGATNDDGNPLFVTELMESSLRVQLEKRALSEVDVTTISLDVAQALNYLHQKKPSPIIHRDISSANVLLWRQGDMWRGKVSDYGTANFMCQTMTLGPGAMIYCAPEAFTPNQTTKMDVYSFGVLLCEMCIRELPNPQNRKGQVTRVKNKLLREIIKRCVEPEPKARPSMKEIINALEVPASRSRWPWTLKKK